MADAPATNDLPDFIEKRYLPSTGNSLYPTLIEYVTQERQTQTVVHRIIGRASPEVSLGVTDLRTGTMSMIFANNNTEFMTYLATGVILTLRSYSNYKLDRMHFAISGPISAELDPETRSVWRVSFEYAEVA